MKYIPTKCTTMVSMIRIPLYLYIKLYEKRC